MLGIIKRMREKKKREQEELERMRLERRCAAKSMGLSIWYLGPGRPMENSYKFVKKDIDEDKKILTINFEEDIKCTVYNPVGVHWDGCLPTIQDADKIVWEGHYYGPKEYRERRFVNEYIKIDKAHVRCIIELASNEILDKISVIDVNEKALSSRPV